MLTKLNIEIIYNNKKNKRIGYLKSTFDSSISDPVPTAGTSSHLPPLKKKCEHPRTLIDH